MNPTRLVCCVVRSQGVVSLLAAAALLVGCGTHYVQNRAREQADAGQYEGAIKTLETGTAEHPDSAELRAALFRTRAEALTKLLTQAGTARAQGQFEAAEALLRRAQALEPDSARVRDLVLALDTERRQAAALTEAEGLASKGQNYGALRVINEALKGNPRHPGLMTLQRRLEVAQRQEYFAAARQSLSETRPISLDFRETGLRTVLDLVSRHSGINFVLDKDIRSDLRVTVYLRDAKVEDALDLIVSTHQLAKKVLDDKTVLIYPNTPDKQREYREQVIKVFYLASADAKQASVFLRSMLKVQDPFVDERSNMIALRDTPDVIQIAERLMAMYDTSEPEVVLEMELLEVNSTRLTELGIKFPDTITLSPLAPVSASSSSSSGGSGLTLSNLRDIGSDRVGVSVAGLLINLRREVGDVETLANPRVRAKNKEKAKVLIGSKVPVVTTVATSSGFVSDSISYLDVGIKLELEPTVYADDDVAIKIAMEVSSIASQIKTSSGGLAYEIGTRNAATTLRLRDGETQVLAGLINRQERTSSARVPGLGDVPVLGRLFSSQLDNGTRTEVVFAITPRVVRNLRRPDANESELWVGTESYTRLRGPGGRAVAVDAVGDKAGAGAAGVAGTAGAGPAATAAGAPTSTPMISAPEPAAPAAPPPMGLRWQVPPGIKAGQEFEAELVASTPIPVRGLSLSMQFDKAAFTVLDTKEGEWLTSDQSKAGISKAADGSGGLLQFGVIRYLASGVSGEGVAVRVRLKALHDGALELPAVQVKPIAAGVDAPTPGSAQPLRVEVGK